MPLYTNTILLDILFRNPTLRIITFRKFRDIKVFYGNKIGDGATGAVFKGSYEKDDNIVAVKVISKQLNVIKWQELEVLRKVQDLNIVRYFHTHTNERDDVKQTAIAMELATTDLLSGLRMERRKIHKR